MCKLNVFGSQALACAVWFFVVLLLLLGMHILLA